ncbi:MAG: GNAT family N-acetyltransferase [Thermodesulfobacteriota bacterium]|nr:GNAT family N-acetyltransferase [Thermodesulfobacteriota bacterium]
MNQVQYEIRQTTMDDVSAIAELTAQLGYSSSEFEIQQRLSTLLNSQDHVIYVSLVSSGKIVGWIHVYVANRVESGSFAEIGGFVVSASFRRKGIGKALLKAAENWTVQNELTRLRVRSNSKRKDAKEFYSNMGFSISKQQRVFDKKIG